MNELPPTKELYQLAVPFDHNKSFPVVHDRTGVNNGIDHIRFRVECFSKLIADKVFNAIKTLKFQNPEIEQYTRFSWDTGEDTQKFVIKCWIPVAMPYIDATNKIKAIVWPEKFSIDD